MAHRPGAGEFTVELADERDAVGEAKLSAGGGEPEFFAGVAPSTTKLAPGSVWNTAASARSLTQSCAQASRARSEHGVTIERQRTIEAGAQFAPRVGAGARIVGECKTEGGFQSGVGDCKKAINLARSSADASPPYGFMLLPGTTSSGFAMKLSSFSLSQTKSAPFIALE